LCVHLSFYVSSSSICFMAVVRCYIFNDLVSYTKKFSQLFDGNNIILFFFFLEGFFFLKS
jgi:hypothetical protein